MDDVAAAIADPVRRDILVMLREQRLPAGQIAGRFMISRPAVSRHLRVLRESGLVRDTLVGRQLVSLVAPEHREEQEAVVNRLLIGELPYIDVVRHTACVDTTVPVAAHHGVVREEAAEPRALVVVAYELV